MIIKTKNRKYAHFWLCLRVVGVSRSFSMSHQASVTVLLLILAAMYMRGALATCGANCEWVASSSSSSSIKFHVFVVI